MEIWKDIPGYNGFYQISNLGNVKSLSRTIIRKNNKLQFIKEKILKPIKNGHGYLFVNLSINGKVKVEKIHKLMAETFLNHTAKKGYHIDHKDNNRTNNNLENIQILTIRQNVSKTIKKTSSKYTGVSFEKSRNKWVAMIYVNGLHKKIGRFDNEYDAHLAYENELSKII